MSNVDPPNRLKKNLIVGFNELISYLNSDILVSSIFLCITYDLLTIFLEHDFAY